MVQKACSPIGPALGDAAPGFGTDGIRGLAGTVLTPALCLQVGYWVGRVLQAEGPVLIGMDSRTSGSMVVAALTAGLRTVPASPRIPSVPNPGAASPSVWPIGEHAF